LVSAIRVLLQVRRGPGIAGSRQRPRGLHPANARSRWGLAAIDPARAAKLDSVAVIEELLLVGRRYAEKYLNVPSHFGPFLPAGSGGIWI
jgi:hypothetical protein